MESKARIYGESENFVRNLQNLIKFVDELGRKIREIDFLERRLQKKSIEQ